MGLIFNKLDKERMVGEQLKRSRSRTESIKNRPTVELIHHTNLLKYTKRSAGILSEYDCHGSLNFLCGLPFVL